MVRTIIRGVVAASHRRAGLPRVADAVVAGTGLVLLSPVIAVLAALVRWRLGHPVLFRQVRTGLNGRTFEMIKLRTMTDERDADGNLLPDEMRLTRLGRMLRTTSLDELPELWNIFRGDMALVGPRPLPHTFYPRFTEAELRRYEVRPGLTGWAQVNGRNHLGWEERFEMDVWYVDNRTALLDLRIILRTIAAVVTRHGISHHDHATMEELRPHLADRSSA